MSNIQITNIVVKKYRVICTIKLIGIKYSNVDIKTSLLSEMPTLAFHKCKNSKGKHFEELMDSTSLAHILEHMIIDIQTKQTYKALFGTTEWIDEISGIAKIELTYTDDVVCLSAIKKALDVLNDIILHT